jgi:hypothetical protein
MDAYCAKHPRAVISMDDKILVEQVLMAIRRVVRSIDMHSNRLVKTCGLTGPQLILMKEIARFGSPSPSELAHATKLKSFHCWQSVFIGIHIPQRLEFE